MDKFLLFIPVYNCEKQIIRVLAQLDSNILPYISETIVVNNRSSDNTEWKILDYIQVNHHIPISLLRNDENYGLGGSHKVAFEYAVTHSYDYMIVLHGDDQGSIKDIIPILRSGDYVKYDCCLGARFMNGAQLQGYSLFRTFGNRVYNILFSIMCRRMIYDLGSGLNLYKVETLKSRYYTRFPDNLTFNYCMIMALKYFNQRALFFPITWREEDQVSNVKLFSQAKKVLHMLFSFAINNHGFMVTELRKSPKSAYMAQVIASNIGRLADE